MKHAEGNTSRALRREGEAQGRSESVRGLPEEHGSELQDGEEAQAQEVTWRVVERYFRESPGKISAQPSVVIVQRFIGGVWQDIPCPRIIEVVDG